MVKNDYNYFGIKCFDARRRRLMRKKKMFASSWQLNAHIATDLTIQCDLLRNRFTYAHSAWLTVWCDAVRF